MKRILLICLLFSACKSHHDVAGANGVFTPDLSPGPHALVYKTTSDFKTKVPVILSEDKSKIVSYPDPTDVQVAGGYPMPTPLAEGYLLDNRGIDKNAAFLVISYWEYAKLAKAPAVEDMYSMILNKDPFVELCDCGNKRAFKNEQAELNGLIKSGKLREKCRIIK